MILLYANRHQGISERGRDARDGLENGRLFAFADANEQRSAFSYFVNFSRAENVH